MKFKPEGFFSVRVTDGNSCQSLASAPVTVKVNPLPVATITPSGATTFCQGGTVTLDAGAGFSSYLWSDGQTTRRITVNASGTFSVAVSDANRFERVAS